VEAPTNTTHFTESLAHVCHVFYIQDEELDASPFEADDGLMIGDDDDDVSDDEDDDHEVVFSSYFY
jgi:hypothetical protein